MDDAAVKEGRDLFSSQCVICHVGAQGDGGGGQGPMLAGLAGKAAGTNDPQFSYSAALRNSGLTWDAATLGRFLANPTEVVPGTMMVNAVPDEGERSALVAYLLSTRPPGDEASKARQSAYGGWRDDEPGTIRLVRPEGLPPPRPGEHVRNGSQIVPRPEGAAPRAMDGFQVSLYTEELTNPTVMRVAPNGDILVAESSEGRIRILRPSDDDPSGPELIQTFVDGLERPFGIAFYPEADPRWVYVGDANSVKRIPYRSGDLRARGEPQTIVRRLGATANGHWTRDIVFSKTGRLLISVGSQTNVAEAELDPKTTEEIQRWEQVHGLGASWGTETDRATVLSFAPDGSGRSVFATGIRNCVGLSRSPLGDVYCATNERDALGNDLVPDYLTRVREGRFYGWPWFYIGNNEDPRHAGARPDLVGKVTVPDVLFQAHSASVHAAFYPEDLSAPSAFPEDFHGDAFVTLHGSWNRSPRTGYKIVRVMMTNGVPTGEYQDFVVGFVVDDESVWARPYAITVLKDGSLLFSDDENNTVWRVTHN
jgi:glucose/arabinose dehydrogenase/cytochrome c2